MERLPHPAPVQGPVEEARAASATSFPPAEQPLEDDDYLAERRWPFALTLLFAASISAGLWALIVAGIGMVYRWAAV